jgi:predicted ATPase
LNPEISSGWDELLLSMLSKDARLRPNAVQVEQELTALGGEVVADKTHHPQPIKPARHTVGHLNERDRLRAGFHALESGTGHMLCVSGEPGSGKTTLVEDFLAEVQANSGCRIARGRCSERLAGTEAYLPWLEALDNLMHSRNESAARVFKGLAPAWYQQIVPLSAGDSAARLRAETAPSQERLKRELASLLQELSHFQPLVLFFDDLQWADASTVDLLSFLADRFSNLRILVVCTYRPSDLQIAKHPFAQLKQGLQARGVCQEIPLEFLSCADVEHYLHLVFSGHQFPPELAARIHAKTEGSPLFMADVVRYLRDRKVIVEEQGHWVLGQPLNEIDRDLPASVRAMIERKMGQLSEEDLRLLVSASVQGYEFDSAVVAEALSMDTAEVEERLEKLERVYGFVRIREEREFPDHTLTLRCRFVHVLYQNTLYGSLRPTRRAQLAARMAGALERFWGQRSKNVANELALLFEVARDFARAADYFRTAARNAGELFASQEAVKLARRALAMAEMLPETPERLERELSIQILLANALITTLGYGAREVDQAFGRARQLCQTVGETAYTLPALWGLSAFHIMKAQYAETLALGRDFLNVAERKNDAGIVVAHRVIGQALLFTGKLAQAREHFERIVSRYVPAQHQPLVWLYAQEPGMAGRALLGLTLWLLGYPDQALEHSEESLRLGAQVPQANSQANALVWAAIHHVFRRESQRVRELAQSLDRLANEQGLRFWIAVAMLQYGWAIAEQGGTEEGIVKLDRGIAAFRTAGAELVLTFNFGLLAAAYGKAGQIRRGLDTLDEALNLVSRNGETFWEPELHRLRGELLLIEGSSPAVVEPMFQLAIDTARQHQAKSLELRAAMSMSRIWMQQDKRAEARALLLDVYSWFTEGFQTADLQEAEKLLQEISS